MNANRVRSTDENVLDELYVEVNKGWRSVGGSRGSIERYFTKRKWKDVHNCASFTWLAIKVTTRLDKASINIWITQFFTSSSIYMQTTKLRIDWQTNERDIEWLYPIRIVWCTVPSIHIFGPHPPSQKNYTQRASCARIPPDGSQSNSGELGSRFDSRFGNWPLKRPGDGFFRHRHLLDWDGLVDRIKGIAIRVRGSRRMVSEYLKWKWVRRLLVDQGKVGSRMSSMNSTVQCEDSVKCCKI